MFGPIDIEVFRITRLNPANLEIYFLRYKSSLKRTRHKWARTWEYDACLIIEQRKLRRVCANA